MRLLVTIMLVFNTVVLLSQNTIDTSYKVVLHLSACPTISHFETQRLSGIDEKYSLGYGFFVEGMWHPGRLLSVGLMSGYMKLSSDKLPDDKDSHASLSAIPLQVVLSMTFKKLELGMGMGPYLLLSKIDIDKLHNAGKLVFTWTLDVRDYIDDYLKSGNYDVVLSNYPSLVTGMYLTK
jgi:hypothetical protein